MRSHRTTLCIPFILYIYVYIYHKFNVRTAVASHRVYLSRQFIFETLNCRAAAATVLRLHRKANKVPLQNIKYTQHYFTIIYTTHHPYIHMYTYIHMMCMSAADNVLNCLNINVSSSLTIHTIYINLAFRRYSSNIFSE